MKDLIRKDLRENMKLALLGLVIFTVMALQAYRNCTALADALGHASSFSGQQYENENMQPLVSRTFLMEAAFFCAIFGAVLGWAQIHHERHRDLWAFLIHRPITRTRIFLGKTTAGLCLYLLGAGLPLLGLAFLVQIPGRVAAPFEWAMVLPGAASVLAGVVCYFGGFLTGLRQARWYGSRGFGLGLGIVVAMVAAGAPEYWQALLAVLIGGGILVMAVWGSFQSDGYYLGQPLPGRIALTVALTAGCAIVMAGAGLLLTTLLVPQGGSGPSFYSSYVMTRDGAVFKQVQRRNGWEIEDLNGGPARDPETGHKLDMQEFYSRRANAGGATVGFGDQPWSWYKPRFQESAHYFSLCSVTSDTMWYYWARIGRFVGYDALTRRLVVSLGPKGFVPDLRGRTDRFEVRPNERYGLRFSRPRIFTAGDTAYLVDLESRTAKPLFATTDKDRIGGTGEISGTAPANGPQYLVVTRHYVHLLTPEGQLIWKRPYEPGFPDYAQILVFSLSPPGQYALWITPWAEANRKAGWKLPEHVAWLGSDGTVLKRSDLPVLQRPENHGITWQDKLMSLLLPPTVCVLTRHRPGGGLPWEFVCLNFTIAAMCAVGCGWLSRRYRLGTPAQIGWVVFPLLAGPVGFLAFLSAQEWPARESCPSCKKLRLVDRQRCEHCGADFPAPEPTGIEIFEPSDARGQV